MTELIQDELNVKRVVVIPDTGDEAVIEQLKDKLSPKAWAKLDGISLWMWARARQARHR